MGLPKITHATFTCIQPSTGSTVILRRFLIAEEKIFLFAKQSEDPREMTRAVIEVVTNCIQKGPTAEELTTFDLDYMFLKLRSQSVDNIINVTYEDPDTEVAYPLTVNLEDVAVPKPTTKPPVIQLTDTIKMQLRYPSVVDMEAVYDKAEEINNKRIDDFSIPAPDLVSMVIAKCVASVYDDEQVYTPDSEEELYAFLNQLPSKAYKDVQTFFDTMPELHHVIKFKDRDELDREVVLRGIQSFFTF